MNQSHLFTLILSLTCLLFPNLLKADSGKFVTSKTIPKSSISSQQKVVEASKDKNGNLPSDLLKKLFEYYKTKNFKKASQITIGKMGHAIHSILNTQKDPRTNPNPNHTSFYDQLKDFKILGEKEYKNYSIVSLFWVSYLPEKYNAHIHYTKIAYVDYLLKKDTVGNWKITDAKFRNEYILYNKAPKL